MKSLAKTKTKGFTTRPLVWSLEIIANTISYACNRFFDVYGPGVICIFTLREDLLELSFSYHLTLFNQFPNRQTSDYGHR